MTVQLCTLPAKDLIAYADGYLTGGRRELVEAHLAACPQCRDRKAAFNDVDRLLQKGTPLTDDPAGRAAIRTRLKGETGRSTSSHRLRVAPVLVMLLALALTVGSIPAIEASFPLGQFVTFGEIERSKSREESTLVEHVAPSDPGVEALPFRTVEPATLPLGLVRVERSTPNPERLEMLYRNEDDLALLILQSPARPGMVTIDGPAMEAFRVADSTVLMGVQSDVGDVSDILWERDGVFFSVLVIEAPLRAYGGFRTPDALEVVEALIAAQDAA